MFGCADDRHMHARIGVHRIIHTRHNFWTFLLLLWCGWRQKHNYHDRSKKKNHGAFCPMRARWALSMFIFIHIPLRARRALSPWILYSDNALPGSQRKILEYWQRPSGSQLTIWLIVHRYTIWITVYRHTSLVENQKGVDVVQRCSTEDQKGVIAIDFVTESDSALLGLNKTLNNDNALLALNWYLIWVLLHLKIHGMLEMIIYNNTVIQIFSLKKLTTSLFTFEETALLVNILFSLLNNAHNYMAKIYA